MPTDAQQLDHATNELDNVAQLLDAIAPMCEAHAVLIRAALEALFRAENLIASVSLA